MYALLVYWQSEIVCAVCCVAEREQIWQEVLAERRRRKAVTPLVQYCSEARVNSPDYSCVRWPGLEGVLYAYQQYQTGEWQTSCKYILLHVCLPCCISFQIFIFKPLLICCNFALIIWFLVINVQLFFFTDDILCKITLGLIHKGELTEGSVLCSCRVAYCTLMFSFNLIKCKCCVS